MFSEDGVIMGMLEDGGFAGATSEGGRTEGALWTEGAAAVTWVAGGFGGSSEEARASG